MVKVAARASPLSRAQVAEVECLMGMRFTCLWVETSGDRDRVTSLRTLGATDFFTREVDALVVEGVCDVAIHSAKDLPDPIHAKLTIAAITAGVDSRDVLVLREGKTLQPGMLIATSSERREVAVQHMCPSLKICNLRGTIQERLDLLEKGEADGVVVAKAALIRLGLLHLNWILLPGETVPLQGQLAILCRKEDSFHQALFAPLDKGKRR